MPQFPYHSNPSKSASKASSGESPAVNPAASKIAPKPKVSDTSNQVEKEPLKFKSVEPKGPVSRVRRERSMAGKPAATKSPFKDSGLFEDPETLVKFRDDFGKPFAITVLAIGIIALIYWFSQPDSDNNELESINPLLVQADELESQPAASLKQTLQLFRQRIEVADQLLTYEESVAVDRGAELKLETLATWDTVNLKNGVSDMEVTQNLETTSRDFINSPIPSVVNNAKIGLMLKRIHVYLDDPKDHSFLDILAQFKDVSKFAKDDLVSAKNLLSVGQVFATKGFSEEASKLFRVINLSFSGSHNSKIANIGIEARQQLNNSNSLLDELKGLLGKGTKIALQPIRDAIGENTREDTISTGGMESILDFLELLVEKNAIPATRTLVEDLEKSIYLISAGIERESIKQKFDDLKKRVELVGTTMEFRGLYSVEGRPITRTSLKSMSKMVVFWSPNNQKSINLIEELSRKYRDFAARRIQVIAIATVANDSDQQQIIEKSNNTRGIEFLTLQKGDANSQAFTVRLPIPKLPYWVLLSNKDKVIALNVAIDSLTNK